MIALSPRTEWFLFFLFLQSDLFQRKTSKAKIIEINIPIAQLFSNKYFNKFNKFVRAQ